MPIFTDVEPFQEWKGRKYTRDEKLHLIAKMISHEFGHLLFDYRDEYDHEDCIMNPVTDYHMDTFLKTKKCNKEHLNLGHIPNAIFR